jgi:hypothetical protein
MSSWRASASAEAQDDLDRLVNVALPFAQQMLAEHGEFFPYGIVVENSGEVRMVAAGSGELEHPASTVVLQNLIDHLRSERDGLRAIALVSDVCSRDSDSVKVELEHSDGHALVVVLPYKTKRLRRGVDYGELAGSSGSPQIWSKAPAI